MKNQQTKIRTTAILLAVLTVLWVILMAISTSGVNPDWKNIDYIKWVSSPDVIYILNYSNVVLLTITVVFLFAFLHSYLQEKNKALALAGILFVPVYSMLNIICYSIQITVVPEIARDALVNNINSDFVVQLIQVKSNSIIGFLNGMAYALLGIPSIIFGKLLFKSGKKFSGIFLYTNGISCIVGITGYIIGSSFLEFGTILGGILFLFSLVSITLEFKTSNL